jgi:ATP-dependent DNA ligase
MHFYDSFKYLFPPRPEFKISPDILDLYDTGEWIAQPKYNGDCLLLFTKGSSHQFWTRHSKPYSKPIKVSVPFNFDGYFVFVGEYINPKNKMGELGVIESPKYIIFDILVAESIYLIGEPLDSRLMMLETLFPTTRSYVGNNGLVSYNHICFTKYEGICKAPTYVRDFSKIYNDVVKTDLYEGLVIKKLTAPLETGYNELNNHLWQLKCRKESKVYSF